MDIRTCLNKKIVFTITSGGSIFDSGIVNQITSNSVLIDNTWWDINKVIVKDIISNNINESDNGGETLING